LFFSCFLINGSSVCCGFPSQRSARRSLLGFCSPFPYPPFLSLFAGLSSKETGFALFFLFFDSLFYLSSFFFLVIPCHCRAFLPGTPFPYSTPGFLSLPPTLFQCSGETSMNYRLLFILFLPPQTQLLLCFSFLLNPLSHFPPLFLARPVFISCSFVRSYLPLTMCPPFELISSPLSISFWLSFPLPSPYFPLPAPAN